MNTPLSEYLDFSQIEKKYGIRVDALRRAARLGRLKTTQVGGQFGCHLVLAEDVEAYLCEFPDGKRQKLRTNPKSAKVAYE